MHDSILQAPVLRARLFHEAVGAMSQGQNEQALVHLDALRSMFAADTHSMVEIEQYAAQALARTGQPELALSRLIDLEPKLRGFHYDLSMQRTRVVSLLRDLGRDDELVDYCRKVTMEGGPLDPLAHLDWVVVYGELAQRPLPTDYMIIVIGSCAVQLGLDVAPARLRAEGWIEVARSCVAARDEANARFASFWMAIEQAQADSDLTYTVPHIIMQYMQVEQTPLFRDLARNAMNNNR